MSQRWPGGLINKTPPTITPPVSGEGGSAPGVWTLEQATNYIRQGTWPQPITPKQMWGWGRNNNGQLGLNNITEYSSPKQVGSLTNWLNVSAGAYFVVSIKNDGSLWSWGQNNTGQLGLGNTTAYSSPKQIGSLTTWSKVSAGYGFGLAIKTDGTLWSWGAGSDGQLGLGNATAYSSPKQVGALTTWSYIAAGSFSGFAIKTDGTLWAWGWNGNGRLGLGNTTAYNSPKQVGALTNWLSVAAGYSHTLAVKTNGTIWAWGRNAEGQLGLGNTFSTYSSPKQIGSLTNWLSVAGGYNFSASIKTDGTLWSWGYNTQGQLGFNNNNNYYSSPKQVGSLTTWSKVKLGTGANSTFAVKTDKTLWSWGGNNRGQLGLGNVNYYSSPKQVGSLTTWLDVSTGFNWTMGIKTS